MLLLAQAVELLSPAFRQEHERLFVPEHLQRLADGIERFTWPREPLLPHFGAELLPPLDELSELVRVARELATPEACASLIEKAGCRNLLILMGMRLTPASLTDATGIPPTMSQLMSAANHVHNPADGLTVGARAWSKHVHRSEEAYWGVCRGGVADKNAGATALIERILANRTWWNVFGHFQHEFVYEARVPTGHGARWGHSGETFIGFLEPFDEEKCPSLNDE